MWTRREFLAASGLAAAIGPYALGSQPGQPSIRKALKFGMIGVGDSIAEKFAIAKAVGFYGVELPSPSELDPDEVLAARDETGIRIPGVVNSVHWNKPLSSADEAVRAEGVEALRHAINQARLFGGSTVLLVPGIVNAKTSYADAYTRSQAAIREVIPDAQGAGVTIALENVWNNFLLSPLEAARYIDELDSPNVGWYFDVGNIVNYGWPADWIRILGKRIVRIDVKEFSRQKRNDEGLWKGFNVEIGEGDCDWPAVVKALREIRYTGWATAEVAGGDEARLRDIAQRMDRVLINPEQ